MSIRGITAIALLWTLSLFLVATVVKAQVFEMPTPLPEPQVLSGPDLGFRIEGKHRGAAIGTLVVRIDGKWIEARVGNVPGAPPLAR